MLWLMNTTTTPRSRRVRDELEDETRLLDTERCRRFVHEDDALTPGDGAADGDRLALAPRQALDRGAHGRDVDPQGVEDLLGLTVHLPVAQPPERPERAAARRPARG